MKVALGAVASALVFGCGHDDSGDSGQTSDLETVRVQLFGSDDSELAAIYGADTPASRELASDRERSIQKCMADAGYDYQVESLGPPTPSSRQFSRLGEAAFIETYGYGRATLWEAEEAQSIAVSGSFVDVNEEIRQGLSSDEQRAYDEALIGPVRAESGEDGRPIPEDPKAGCRGAALALVISIELPADVTAEFDDLNHAIAADPELLAAEEEWSACMASEGFDFARREDAIAAAEASLGALTVAPVGQKRLTAQDVDGVEVSVDIPQLDPVQLEAVSRREIEVASADLGCSETTGYDAARLDVRQHHQLAFVERWQNQLILHDAE